MLGYIGEEKGSRAVFEVTQEVIEEGKYTTYDFGGKSKTSEMSSEIARRVKRRLSGS